MRRTLKIAAAVVVSAGLALAVASPAQAKQHVDNPAQPPMVAER